MAEQQHRNTRKSSDDEEQVETSHVDAAQDTERKEKLDDDVDSILGDIDDVLEENAEEFVRSFVQKGGQ
ncbi:MULTISPECIES: ubiquitin-like protein Pup [unclassified Aeromicrobium]|jgi:ubiquitin-like protein Pup|uniref:ubiquitin-like protein Pup n=1 Tax=unclassified Aeromicrobium TaxID=2633570 RepID=UPI0006FE1515|nr:MULTISPECIES: ubiquitin-like protein Pup [unclassified Aeromicrobium]RYY42318.1 MAG: ubiquitin-like protein Pup [Actinomycetales bacterium]KQO39081.1 ubiquitin [Aeromicrobium sp. Leaf245]KQP24937.1 ubiquitin [Aeromicrobium sp. Leaf272]KQP79561.1 ubiquitin [Aeromicrobium sp. Leaf289]KQP82347.1 ubiquitin [Aeromicrobium sp. Leaf291]